MSRSDHTLYVLYEVYAQRLVGGKWRCVVLRYPPDDELRGHGSRVSGSSVLRCPRVHASHGLRGRHGTCGRAGASVGIQGAWGH